MIPRKLNQIIQGDTLEVLKTFSDECVDCVITSPPYYSLRDYGVEGQLGLEKTLDEYLSKMLAITAELKRVLKKTGTLWWNHGDSYGTGSGAGSRMGTKQGTNRAFSDENLYYKERSRKHRYIYFNASKTRKKQLLKKLRYKILPYPKNEYTSKVL